MEILFFRIANRIAGINMASVREVLLDKETIPFLPVSDYVGDIVINRGAVVGIIDLFTLFSIPGNDQDSPEIILVSAKGKYFGLAVKKIMLVKTVPKKRILPVSDEYFIPGEFLESSCLIGKKNFPIISEHKILEYPDIKKIMA